MTAYPVTIANAHDGGYDLVPGGDVTNPRIGHVYWDDSDPYAPGLVVRLDDGDEDAPASAEAVRVWLAGRGYALDASSVEVVAALGSDA